MKYDQFNLLLNKYPCMYYDDTAKSVVLSTVPLNPEGYYRLQRTNGDDFCDDLMAATEFQFAVVKTQQQRGFVELFFGDDPEKNAYSEKLSFLCHDSDDIVSSLNDILTGGK